VLVESEDAPGSLYALVRAWVQNDPEADPAQYPPAVRRKSCPTTLQLAAPTHTPS
jgi:hypothetical protein